MLSNMRKFEPPENRTFSQGGRANPLGGGAGSLGRMLNGAAILFDKADSILPVSMGADNLGQRNTSRVRHVVSHRAPCALGDGVIHGRRGMPFPVGEPGT